MVFLYLSAIASFEPSRDAFVYLHRQCVPLESDESQVHWGITEGECDQVAKTDSRLNHVYGLKFASITKARRINLKRISNIVDYLD